MRIVGEYVYTLDDPGSFRRDPSDKQNDPRISEMMAVGLDRLIVLERTEQTTKLHEIDLAGATNIAGSQWDEAATRPTPGAVRGGGGRHQAGCEDAAVR
jgi:hypothetical protein